LGDLNNYDIAACVNEIESACRYLVSGFTCLKVLNQEGLVRLSDEDLLFNITNLVFDYGASKIAHVRKNNDISGSVKKSLMNLQTYFPVENLKNIQEAEFILDREKSDK